MKSSRADAARALAIIAPDIPPFEREAVLDHAQDSVGLKHASAQTAVWLSLTAYIRHALTDYDDLLADGCDAVSARHFVIDQTNEILRRWGSRRRIDDSEGPA